MSENRYAERDDPRFALDPLQRARLEGVVATLEPCVRNSLEMGDEGGQATGAQGTFPQRQMVPRPTGAGKGDHLHP